ncbi:MAG: hypothetical protein ACI9TO_000518 [Rickettsiales bacterium]|jgi:hypothetical protein
MFKTFNLNLISSFLFIFLISIISKANAAPLININPFTTPEPSRSKYCIYKASCYDVENDISGNVSIGLVGTSPLVFMTWDNMKRTHFLNNLYLSTHQANSVS